MKKAIVTGGAGFAGFSLVRELLDQDYQVVCPVRPGSPHNKRLEELKKETGDRQGQNNLILISLDNKDILKLHHSLQSEWINMSGCLFFHLAWAGRRDDNEEQNSNIIPTLDAVRIASVIGSSRILITGSQAEYGFNAGGSLLPDGFFKKADEDTPLDPVNSYGSAKTAAMYLSRDLARHVGISWNWLRIFSLYGKYEHEHTMLSYLKDSLEKDEVPHLSSCTQTWDYLNVKDAARAMVSVAERGKEGEVYNIAHGGFRPLKEYTEIIRQRIAPDIKIDYAEESGERILSLRPSVDKLMTDTGWKPEIQF